MAVGRIYMTTGGPMPDSRAGSEGTPVTTEPYAANRRIPSPKQFGRGDWYPCYAGYPESFVKATVMAYLGDCRSLIDPWSGSGTTSVVAARLGINAVGVDVNPALTVIAKGRLHRPLLEADVEPVLLRFKAVASRPVATSEADLLETWLTPQAATHFRSLRNAILDFCPTSPRASSDESTGWIDSLQPGTCFMLCGLFLTLRRFLAPFRGTNPTWLQTPPSPRNRVRPSRALIERTFLGRLDYLGEKLARCDNSLVPSLQNTHFITGSVTALPFEDDAFGAALTSPPYATRLDYVTASLPELAMLGMTSANVAELRRSSIGSPVVKGLSRNEKRLASPYANQLVERVLSHPSKGSTNYYGPWLQNYFSGLQSGLTEVRRVVEAAGRIGVVIQDSFYKEIHLDLQRVATEILDSLGLSVLDRLDFAAPNVRSQMNPRARHYRTARVHRETLIISG